MIQSRLYDKTKETLACKVIDSDHLILLGIVKKLEAPDIWWSWLFASTSGFILHRNISELFGQMQRALQVQTQPCCTAPKFLNQLNTLFSVTDDKELWSCRTCGHIGCGNYCENQHAKVRIHCSFQSHLPAIALKSAQTKGPLRRKWSRRRYWADNGMYIMFGNGSVCTCTLYMFYSLLTVLLWRRRTFASFAICLSILQILIKSKSKKTHYKGIPNNPSYSKQPIERCICDVCTTYTYYVRIQRSRHELSSHSGLNNSGCEAN